MNAYNYEIYTKNEETLETGWNIHFVTVIAENKKEARKKLESYPFFDVVILCNYCVKWDMKNSNYKDNPEFLYEIEKNVFYMTNLKPIEKE